MPFKQNFIYLTPYACDEEAIECATATAVAEAVAKGLEGREVTPFVLRRVNELTRGESLVANVALINNNAKVGAQIAMELSQLLNPQRGIDDGRPCSREASTSALRVFSPRLVVVGGTVQDITSRPLPGVSLVLGSSTPGQRRSSWGGVARNIAEAAARLGALPLLVSAVGDDAEGAAAVAHAAAAGIDVSGVRRSVGARTAVYSATLDERGDLVAAIADMDALRLMDAAYVGSFAPALSLAELVAVDANLDADALRALVRACKPGQSGQSGPALLFEPTSVAKAARIVDAGAVAALTFLKPNADELRAIAAAAGAADRNRGAPEGVSDCDGESGGEGEGQGHAGNESEGRMDLEGKDEVVIRDAMTGGYICIGTCAA